MTAALRPQSTRARLLAAQSDAFLLRCECLLLAISGGSLYCKSRSRRRGSLALVSLPGKLTNHPTFTLTPRMLLPLAAHDRGIWPTASSSVPLQSAAPRPWRHSSLVVGVDRV